VIGRIAAFVFRRSPAGVAQPLTVRFTPRADGNEACDRAPAAGTFGSVRSVADSAISKRIGVAVLAPVPHVEGGRLKITLRRVSVRGVAIPHFLTPGITTREDADAAGPGRFAVEATLPMFGPLVAYRGMLTPARVT
jgi:hypothetical protein